MKMECNKSVRQNIQNATGWMMYDFLVWAKWATHMYVKHRRTHALPPSSRRFFFFTILSVYVLASQFIWNRTFSTRIISSINPTPSNSFLLSFFSLFLFLRFFFQNSFLSSSFIALRCWFSFSIPSYIQFRIFFLFYFPLPWILKTKLSTIIFVNALI